MKVMKKIIYLCVFISLSLILEIKAQEQHTEYFLRSVPQANYLNVAQTPENSFYIGLPALSSFYLGFKNNALVFDELIAERSDGTKYYNINGLPDMLHEKNFFALNVHEELIAFGLKAKKNYFNFSINEKFLTRFSYPKDFVNQLVKGNGYFLGENADISGMGLNMTHYREYALGCSRKLNEKLSTGVRLKYLQGLSNVYFRESDISLYTASDYHSITAKSKMEINTSLPLADDSDDETSAGDYLNNWDNYGFAIDLGVNYKYTEKIEFAVSLLDLGYINWNKDLKTYKNSNAEFSFEGIDFNGFINNENDSADYFEEIIDSLSETFDLKESFSTYSTSVNAKIYIGATYKLTKKSKIGALLRSDMYYGKLHPSLSLSYIGEFSKLLSLSASWTAMNRSVNNIGLGFSINLGAYQIYMVGDNICSILWPEKTKSVNAHFGMNFVFGYKKKEPVIVD